MTPSAAPAMSPRMNPMPPLNPYVSRIRDLIYQEAGIFYAENKLHTLQDRCEKRMGELGSLSLQTYYEQLRVDTARSEITSLLNNITVERPASFAISHNWMRSGELYCRGLSRLRKRPLCTRSGYGVPGAPPAKSPIHWPC